MNKNLDLALNTLYQRQITSREQLLNEMLRVRMTLKQFEESTEVIGKDQLFQVMKSATEDELGFFPADREDFSEIYEALKAIEPLEFTLYIYQDDRMGTVISPLYLSRYICTRIKSLQPKTILIPEAEKHLSGLRDIITQSSTTDLTLTTQLKPMYLLLKLAFGEHKQVKIKYESIYSECLPGEKYDYIYLLPAFGARPDEPVVFLTRDSDGVALENMLGHLTEQGTLDAIVPAKITFAGGGNEKLRSYITENFSVQSLHILPEGTFRPATAVKTYFLTVTARPQAKVDIGSLKLNKETLAVTDKQSIPASKFKVQPDWRIELLLSEDDENIQRFRRSDVEKIKLKEVAEVFRGKSVLKRDTSPGSVAVLNISDIENGEIDYTGLDTIEEEERKIKRYQLENGDVVLSCRGTAIKSAVFQAQDRIIIASANLIVIRPKERVKGGYIKIFLESPIGLAMIKSFQRGTTIMNINHADIMEMEIPLLPLSVQHTLIDNYNDEFSLYKETIGKAESRWDKIRNNLYNQLI